MNLVKQLIRTERPWLLALLLLSVGEFTWTLSINLYDSLINTLWMGANVWLFLYVAPFEYRTKRLDLKKSGILGLIVIYLLTTGLVVWQNHVNKQADVTTTKIHLTH